MRDDDSPLEKDVLMSEQDLQKLEEFSDEEVAQVLDFIEAMGSIEDAKAAIEALSQLRAAA